MTGQPLGESLALQTFLSNYERQGALVSVVHQDAEAIREHLEERSRSEPGKEPRFLKERVEKHVKGRAFIHEWHIVMQATFVETYLHDVLVTCAEIDPLPMKDSKQAATYQEVMTASSIDELAAELRSRWARNFIDRGGPARWIDRLTRMGATGFPPDLANKLEQMWGIRHVVVHSAGRVTAEFVRRHPTLGFKADQPLTLSKDPVLDYIRSGVTFVKTTDSFLITRYGPKLSSPV